MPQAPSSAGTQPAEQRPKSRRSVHTQAHTRIAQPKSESALLPPEAQPITARLAAAGSRRGELEALLHAAPAHATVETLRSLVLEQNVTGKGSTASRVKVWRQVKQNYVLDERVPEYRALLEALAAASSPIEHGLLLFLMLARTDRLFRELALASVSPQMRRAGSSIEVADVQLALERLVGSRQRWTQETLTTVRQHALSALKDFSVLQGGTKKKTARIHTGPQVTLFAARLAWLEGVPARRIPESVWFQLLGLDAEAGWHALQLAAAAGVLRCRRQADVVELELPPLPPAPDAAV